MTEVPSVKVKPPRVLESPVSFECVVENIVSLGEHGGAGQLVIAKVVHIHVKSEFLDENDQIDSEKLDLVARLGGATPRTDINSSPTANTADAGLPSITVSTII